ncbi:MAG: hypothetical protein K2X38_19855 [Gemmataceae bacterium]|nr:hypothetical protein [Gemmataceae bacterium]
MADPQSLYEQAAQFFDAGDFTAALELSREGLFVDEDHPHLHLVFAMSCAELGEHADAIESFEEASTRVVLPPICQLTLAELYVRTKCPETARAILEFLAEPGRCPANLLSRVAQAFGLLGDDEAALGVCKRLIELRPDFHPAYFGAAYYLTQLERPVVEILPFVQRAFDLKPEQLSYRVSLALMQANLGRIDEASATVRSVCPGAIGCAGCIRRLLPAIEKLNDNELTAAWWTRALALEQGAASGSASRDENKEIEGDA